MSRTSSERTVYAWQTSIGVAVVGTAAAVVLIVVFTYMDDYIGSFWSQLIYFAAFFVVVIGLAERSRRSDRANPARLGDASQPVTPAGLPGPFVCTQAFGVLGIAMIVSGGVDRRRAGRDLDLLRDRARPRRRCRPRVLGRDDGHAAERGPAAVIRAAGGVLRRDGLIAVVHRPAPRRLVAAEGQARAGRGRRDGGRARGARGDRSRAVIEHDLGTVTYTVTDGRPKSVRYYVMSGRGRTPPSSRTTWTRWSGSTRPARPSA